ncbi:hypothetical protein PTI45_02794 [Paenibacillus nuruki]|uniref:Copper amine oxidase-like N-terminal domain-containing protein n=2 Tax=Paenibacillus nuruki TaxID=1886670 RepID=A0A1E3L2D0_9BACL|nr:hypothetical protein PTI45_02794 [Paenibacillus nuruki]
MLKFIKISIFLILSMLLCLPNNQISAAVSSQKMIEISVDFNGKLIKKHMGYTKDGYLMLPLNDILQEFDFKTKYYKEYEFYTLYTDDSIFYISIDKTGIAPSNAKWTGFPVEGDMINGTLYLPIISVLNGLNCYPNYNSSEKYLSIETWGKHDESDFYNILKQYYRDGSRYPDPSILDQDMQKKVFYQIPPFLNDFVWNIKPNIYKVDYIQRNKAIIYVEGTIESNVLVKKISTKLTLLDRGKGWKVLRGYGDEYIGYIPDTAVSIKKTTQSNQKNMISKIENGFKNFIQSYNDQNFLMYLSSRSTPYLNYLKDYAKRPGHEENYKIYIQNQLYRNSENYGKGIKVNHSTVWYISEKQAMLTTKVTSVDVKGWDKNSNKIYGEVIKEWIISMDLEKDGSWKVGKIEKYPDHSME